MRLCDRQGTIRRGQGARARRFPRRRRRHGANPQIGDIGRKDVGRRQAADRGDQSAEALDLARAALHRRRRARDVAGRRRRRQPGGPGRGGDRQFLAARLAKGCPTEDELDAVRRRREFPVRITQAMQVMVQNNLISVALKPGDRPLRAPLFARLINAYHGYRASRRGSSASARARSMCARRRRPRTDLAARTRREVASPSPKIRRPRGSRCR